jgi:hypothetical protein
MALQQADRDLKSQGTVPHPFPSLQSVFDRRSRGMEVSLEEGSRPPPLEVLLS